MKWKPTTKQIRLLICVAVAAAAAAAVLAGGDSGFVLLMMGVALAALLGGSALAVREFAPDPGEPVNVACAATRREAARVVTWRLGVVTRRVGRLFGLCFLAGWVALGVLAWPREHGFDHPVAALVGFLLGAGLVLVLLPPIVATGAVMGAVTRSKQAGAILALLVTIPILMLTSYADCCSLADHDDPRTRYMILVSIFGKQVLAALLMLVWLFLLECRKHRRAINFPGRLIRGFVYGAAAVEVAYLLFWADWRDFFFWIFGV